MFSFHGSHLCVLAKVKDKHFSHLETFISGVWCLYRICHKRLKLLSYLPCEVLLSQTLFGVEYYPMEIYSRENKVPPQCTTEI